MPRWAWPRLFSVLWLALTTCEWSSYSIPHQCPIPPWSHYPLKTLFSPYDGYSRLCWTAVAATVNSEIPPWSHYPLKTLLTLWWLLPSMLEGCGGQNHRIQKQRTEMHAPPVSIFLPGIWHMTHTTALPGFLIMVNLLFPRTCSWSWALTSQLVLPRSFVNLQEKWSPAMTQRLSSVSLTMETTVATLPFPYTPRCTKVTQFFKTNISRGLGKRETQGMTSQGASRHW